jgi:UDP-N-acetylglucosamine:LPS N-acetylglucosamine transferase
MNQRRILVFSCHAGGGHISAAAAIKTSLSTHYSVEVVDALGTIFLAIDPVYYATFKNYCAQDLYNFLLKHNKKKIINFISALGGICVVLPKKFIYNLLFRYLKQEQPDLIISVIPLFNAMIKEVAHDLGIPFILVPTDLDGTTFTSNIHFRGKDQVPVSVGFDYPEVRATLLTKEYEYNLKPIGFPVRASFLEPKNSVELKETYHIPGHVPVLMLIMGATGSNAIMEYIKRLQKITFELHVMICIGRNTELRNAINAAFFPAHITYTIVDYAIDIADVMAISDLCITKPGSCTFSECLYMQLPMLIDNTSAFLSWERFNAHFLNKHHLGAVVTAYDQAPELITKYFKDNQWRDSIQLNMRSIEKKNFKDELLQLVQQTFSSDTMKVI